MLPVLPDYIEPLCLAEQRAQMQGVVDLKSCDRLTAACGLQSSAADVRLDFGIDEHGFRYLALHARATVQLSCGRCLEPLQLNVESRCVLGMAPDEAGAERLPAAYEPLIVAPEPIALRELIEDELLLSLPLVAMHPVGQCQIERREERVDRERSGRPFARLAELKSRIRAAG
jgi:uncharacterized protein